MNFLSKSISSPLSLFDDFFEPMGIFNRESAFSPSLDISENDKNFEIVAELPGMKIDEINLSVEDDILCIHGEKKFESEEKDKNYHRIERRYGEFRRKIRLPRGANNEKISAEFKNGLLKISIPKEEQKTQKIEIK